MFVRGFDIQKAVAAATALQTSSLDQAINARVPSVSYVMVDPRLDNLCGDPRFDAVLARLKLGMPPERAK